MSEEKKLSKDERLKSWLKAFYGSYRDEMGDDVDLEECDQAFEQIKSCIESSTQEKQAKQKPRQTYGIIEELDGVKPPKEPSEAEVEGLLMEKARELEILSLVDYVPFATSFYAINNDKAKEFLARFGKEYDELRRG